MSETKETIRVLGPLRPGYEQVLTPSALDFVADLARRFGPRVTALLRRRAELQHALDGGALPDFLPETRDVRAGDWRAAPLPPDLLDRRVEITGPVDRKMVINALNSGASCFMADFEDACAPTWENLIVGQLNLSDAIAGTITYDDPGTGKHYALGERPAVLLVRPRGWHLIERHLMVDGRAVPAALFDFGLYVFRNARDLLTKGAGPYFYLPKLESHLEARLWNDVFLHTQERLGIPRGSIKATVLIAALPAAFQMDEILYELREHAAGLNCGRWDYIFSFIKKFRRHPDRVLPDRHQVTMVQPFMRAYTQLVIRTCHRRGVHAMGGMAAQIPIKDDPAANAQALEKVRQDKLREATDGHDGTWVAHPALVSVAKAVFDEHMPGPNQLSRLRDDVRVRAADLLAVPEGNCTEAGLRNNVRVGIQYIEAWLRGFGAVPIYNLMEDVATAEIARTQVWQWLANDTPVEGTPLTRERVETAIREEMQTIRREVGDERFTRGRFPEAERIFAALCLSSQLADFLTLPAYEQLLAQETVSVA